MSAIDELVETNIIFTKTNSDLNGNVINQMIDEYTKYVLWGEKIVKFEDEFKNFGNVNKSNITRISKQIFNMKNISIFYNGNNNHDNKIKKLLSKNR